MSPLLPIGAVLIALGLYWHVTRNRLAGKGVPFLALCSIILGAALILEGIFL